MLFRIWSNPFNVLSKKKGHPNEPSIEEICNRALINQLLFLFQMSLKYWQIYKQNIKCISEVFTSQM